MARIRSIKPDFFTDKKLASCGESAMLLFAGLWTLADREGRLKDIPFWIHGQIFPHFPDKNVDELLILLANKGLIVRYSVDGETYIQVVNFTKHQHIHIKEGQSVIPPPKHGAQHRKKLGLARCSVPEKKVSSTPDSTTTTNTDTDSTVRKPSDRFNDFLETDKADQFIEKIGYAEGFTDPDLIEICSDARNWLMRMESSISASDRQKANKTKWDQFIGKWIQREAKKQREYAKVQQGRENY